LFASKFAIIFVCLILPCGIVLVMFLSDLAFDAIEEMGRLFWRDEFRWATGLACGWLTGSGVPAWIHRKAPRLQGAQGQPSVQPGAKEKSRLGALEWMYVGFAAVSIAGVLIAGVAAYSLSHSEAGVVMGLVGIGAVLTASPFLGLWMLKKKSAI